jgi:hypothetical protein
MRLLAHLRAKGTDKREGSLEPLVGRETEVNTGSFGKTPSRAEICWAPGSKITKNEEFWIREKGLWEKNLDS